MKKLLVLGVDDEPAIVRGSQIKPYADDYAVIIADCATQALEVDDDNRPVQLVLDLMR